MSGLYTVGSGDSFFAGMIAALLQALPLADAARLGVAAGAANIEEMGAAVLVHSRAEALRDQVQPLPT